MANFSADFRFALRQLRKSPGFTAAALGCLALGVGATSAIFSVVNAVVLRPLAYADSARLVRLYTDWPAWTGGGMFRFAVSPPEFDTLRRSAQTFESIDAWQSGGANLAPPGREPVRVNMTQVSGGLMSALGVQPFRGRVLTPADDAEGAPLQTVLSYGLWQGAFGGDDGAVGREVLVNGVKTTIAGVMPRGFEFPPGEPEAAEMWTPLQLALRDMDRWGNHRLALVGRLKSGTTLAQAARDLDRIESTHVESRGPTGHRFDPKTHTLSAYPLLEETVGNVRPAMLLMLGATGLVLLIACANVANLLLARAQTRQREVALRQAMGATQGSLLRQFLIEGLLLSGTGAALGLGLAWALLRVILAVGGPSIPRAGEVGLDGAVLAFAAAAAVATGLVFAMAPLAQTIRAKLFDTLKAGGRSTATREAHWLRHGLIVGEMALAVMLLAGASLLLDAFRRLTRVEPGVRGAEQVMTMRVTLPQQTYSQPAGSQRFWRETLERVRNLPGVTAAGILNGLPPQRPLNANDTYIEGFVPVPGGPMHNVDYWNVASPGAFEMLGVELVEGRLLEPRDGDGAPPVLVVNQTLARTFYGKESAIGRRVKPGGKPTDNSPWYTIVGVVKDIRNRGLDRSAGTELFFSHAQAGNLRFGTLLVKTTGDPWNVLGPVRDQIRALDPSLPLAQVRPLDEVIAQARARPRFLALLLTVFASVALGLAALGIFSVMSYAVSQRTSEFGVRMALGAQTGQVRSLVLGQGMRLVLAGIVAGALLSAALTRVIRNSVAGLGEVHWMPLAITALVLVAVSLAACWTPARRATRVDPVLALRSE